MAIKFKLGTRVEQVRPAAIVGVVTDAVIIDGEVHFKVDCGEGDEHTARFFSEDQLVAAE